MPFEIPSGKKVCSTCGSIRVDALCVRCDTTDCPKCKTKDGYVRAQNIQCCASCLEYNKQCCPKCSGRIGFQHYNLSVHGGRPYQIAASTPGGPPQLAPLTCPVCHSKGDVPLGCALTREQGKDYLKLVSILNKLTENYQVDLRFQQQKINETRACESAAQQAKLTEQRAREAQVVREQEEHKRIEEAKRRDEIYKAQQLEKERRDKLEKETKERIKQEAAETSAKEERDKEVLRAKGAATIAVIENQMSALKEKGSPEVKLRLSEDNKYANNDAFKNLLFHFPLIDRFDGGFPIFIGTAIRIPGAPGLRYVKYELNKHNKDLSPLLKQVSKGQFSNLFEACFEYIKNQEKIRLSVYLRKYIDYYSPRQDHDRDSALERIAQLYVDQKLPEKISTPFCSVHIPAVKRGSQFEGETDFKFITFEEFLRIRNEIWNESFFNRTFREAKSEHFNEKTDAKDKVIKKQYKDQLAFMNDYWEQTNLQLDVPKQYQDHHPDLQRLEVKHDYFESLQATGKASVNGRSVDSLSFEEVAEKMKFRFFPRAADGGKMSSMASPKFG